MDILQMSIYAAFLIIAIITLRSITLYKLPKRTFLVLWSAVVCRLLIPFSIPFRFSLYTGIEALKQALKGTAQPTVSAASDTLTIVPNTGAAALKNVAGGCASAVSVYISPLTLAWLAGIGVCAVFFIVSYIKFLMEFKTALPVQNNFIDDWMARHRLWLPVRIRQSDKIKAPLTYGVFHPIVLLPSKTDWTNQAALQYVLTHEYVHIKRFDTLAKLLLAAAVCVHWFNPFVWIMYVLANRDIELACDESVVRTFGEAKKADYALILIGLEEKKSRFAPLISGFSKSPIEEKITAIMKIKKYSISIIVVAVLLVVGVTAGFATSDAKADDNAGLQDNSRVLIDASPSPDSAAANNIEKSTETTAEPSENTANASNNSWVWPVEGCYTVTSSFGKRVHPVTGATTESDHICISGTNSDGANVYAALAGTVSETGYDNEQGNYITISHNNGIETIYQHLNKMFASTGDTVAMGDTIGTVGKTGMATGPCLGFCVYVNGVATNPLEYYTIVSTDTAGTTTTTTHQKDTAEDSTGISEAE